MFISMLFNTQFILSPFFMPDVPHKTPYTACKQTDDMIFKETHMSRLHTSCHTVY